MCVDAAELLSAEGRRVRVVSMPCWEDFSIQDASYIAEVLPAGVPKLAVEAATSFGWDRWADAVGQHRPLRCLGPRGEGARGVRVYRRARGGRGASHDGPRDERLTAHSYRKDPR